MKPLDEQVLSAWQTNHRVNMRLLEELDESALELTTSKRGGGSVGHQLVHLYNVRYWQMESLDKKLVEGLKTLKITDEKSIPIIRELHELSTDLIGKMFLRIMAGERKGWPNGIVPLLTYFINHEAHHRGNMLLTLKICGYKLPKEFKYAIYDWKRI